MRLLIPFIFALGASLLLTPVVRAAARAVGLIARPSMDRWHSKPTALVGGVAIYGGFLAGLGGAFWIGGGGVLQAARGFGMAGFGIILSATMMFCVGFADDKLKLRPTSKLIAQGVAGAALVSFGVMYPITPWTTVNIVATLFWFLALTNAINLLDNMDGVAVGVAAIAAIFLAVSFWLEGAWMLVAVCVALVGAAAGFLPYNFHRASIFMGDSGSLFLGAILAGLGAAYPSTASGSIISVLFVPAFIVIIPILDTLLVTFMRTLAGRPISMGGRDHTSHRLVGMGLSERQVALLLYAFAAAGGLLAVALRQTSAGFGLWAGAIFSVVLAIFAAYLGRMYTYSTEEARRSGRVTLLVNDLLYKRRALEVVMDLVLFAVAYYGAFLLRYDGSLPASQAALLEATLALSVACKSISFGLLGVYRGIWQQVSVADLHRLVRSALLGSLLTVTALVFLFREAEFARTIFILDGILVALLTIGARVSFRSLDRVRHSLNGKGERSLIYGAGRAGELVLRELLSNPDLNTEPVGFIDDDHAKHGRLIHGLPVLGGSREFEQLTIRHQIRRVIIGTRKLDGATIESLVEVCHRSNIELLQLELELRAVQPVGARDRAMQKGT